MTAVVGYAGILLALVSAAALVIQGARAQWVSDVDTSVLKLPVLGIAAGAVLAMGALEVALLSDDFSIEYVARNSSAATPTIFKAASAWAALEGSIVLWGLVLAGYTFAVWRSARGKDRLGSGALAIMGVVGVFFFGIMATVANPFVTLAAAPADGFGANPLLQNHILMAVHPPMLYLGFVGLTTPFAFAISAMAMAEEGPQWLERTRLWTIIAWSFLTAGIVLGGLWSYEVLGWGGYWAWDPVENASFVPWLLATAFIHSSVVQRRRGMLQAWNLALVIATFASTILGTFLTRSGVIASVHSFTQSEVGPALLAFFGVIVISSFGLFVARAHLVASSPRLESLSSREGVFLVNNLLLALFAFVVLVGTLYPILVEAFSGDEVSVGRPFFDRAASPLGFALLLAMGIGPLTPYRVARAKILWDRLRLPVQLGLVGGAVVVLGGVRRPSVILAVTLSGFVAAGIVTHLVEQARRAASGSDRSAFSAAWRLIRRDPGYWGGQASHLGVAILVVGITVSAAFGVNREIPLAPGESAVFEGYTLTYIGPFQEDQPNRMVLGAQIRVDRGDSNGPILEPRLNQYPNQVQAVPSPAVRTGLTDDLYLSLARIDADGIVVDAFHYPFILLVWLGGFLAAAGALWSVLVRKPASDRTKRPEPETADV